MPYERIEARTVERRPFRIVVGLRNVTMQTPKAAIRIIHNWMKFRAESSQPFLTGAVSIETLVYTWKGAENGADDPEPAIVFQGDVSVIQNHDLPDCEVINLLNVLGELLGLGLCQPYVHVSYREGTWILRVEDQTSPGQCQET